MQNNVLRSHCNFTVERPKTRTNKNTLVCHINILYLQIMGNKLVTYTAYFNHQHLFLLSMATKAVTPSSAEGALIWTSKFSDFLIIINPNSKNSFCVHERSCSHNIRVNQILWRIHFQRSISLDSRSSRAGIPKNFIIVWSDSNFSKMTSR